MIENKKTNIDKNKYAVGFFIDLSKTFHTTHHNILIAKLVALFLTCYSSLRNLLLRQLATKSKHLYNIYINFNSKETTFKGAFKDLLLNISMFNTFINLYSIHS